jgi:hypothetical protein
VVTAPTPIVVVQHISTFCAGATSCPLAFSSSNSPGDTLIYVTGDAGSAILAPTDNNSNTIANALTFSGSAAERVDFVSLANSGSNIVTAHGSTSANLHIHLWEIFGLAGKVQDASGTTTQTGSTALTVSTSGPTVVANELVLGFFVDAFNSFTYTAGSGFSPTESTVNNINTDSAFSEVKIVSLVGTQTATATLSISDNMDNLVVTFK